MGLEKGEAGSHLLPLGLETGTVGKGEGEGLLQAETLHQAATLELNRGGQAQGGCWIGLAVGECAPGCRVGRQQGSRQAGRCVLDLWCWFPIGGDQGIEGLELGIELVPAAFQPCRAWISRLALRIGADHWSEGLGQARRGSEGPRPDWCESNWR